MANAEQIKGEWDQVKGKVQKKWGMMTDRDLDSIKGDVRQLAGKVKEYYGMSKEEAENQVSDFIKSVNKKISDENIVDTVVGTVKQGQEKFQQGINAITESTDKIYGSLTGYISNNPMASVGIAALAGIGIMALLQLVKSK